jgi:hypothetical protein
LVPKARALTTTTTTTTTVTPAQVGITPCAIGTFNVVTGKVPCAPCASASTCAFGVNASCAADRDTECVRGCTNGSTWSVTGSAPCAPCDDDTTCQGNKTVGNATVQLVGVER